MTVEDLAERIAAMAADIDAAMCRWLELIAEFDRREGWAIEGASSCAAWVSWRCAVGPTAAREHVRVARRLADLPRVRAAFARGELSYSKVRAITRVEDVAREEELVELAGNATAAQLERIVSSYRSAARVETDAERALAERFLSLTWDDDGALRVSGRLPADQGALLMRAIELAAEQLRGDTAEPVEPVQARRADALSALADRALAGEARRTGGDRTQVVIHVDDEALAAPTCCTGHTEAARTGRRELEHGPALAHATARRLACDAAVVRVAEREGQPLSVGRKARTVPPALRRALRARDGGCRFPGCTHHRFVDAHHIRHWADGGETSLDNLVHLCTHHHRLLHEGGFTVRAKPHGFEFRTPTGRLLREVTGRPRRARDRHEPALPRASAEAPLQTLRDRLDLGLATDAMLWIAPPGRSDLADAA